MTLEEKNNKIRLLINKLFEELKETIPDKSNISNEYSFKIIQEIFKVEMEYYGLKYSFDSSSDIDLRFGFESNPYSGGYYHNDGKFNGSEFVFDKRYIFLNMNNKHLKHVFDKDVKKRISACKNLLICLFHEIRHLRQDLLVSDGISSWDNLRFAREAVYIKEFYSIYGNNHNRIAMEADAELYALLKEHDLFGFSNDRFNQSVVFDAVRDYSFMSIPGTGYHSRDEYISKTIDSILSFRPSRLCYFELYPLLKKEYNDIGCPRKLSDLITNYKKELEDANKIQDPETKKIIISNIMSMYFELINKRIKIKSPFELYEAVHNHGNEYVQELLNELNLYNKQEKRRLLKTRTMKRDAELKNLTDKKYIGRNFGYVIKKSDKEDSFIFAGDLARKIANNVNTYLVKNNLDVSIFWFFLNAKFVEELIPIYGYYVLKDKTKISIENFVMKYVIPKFLELKGKEDKYKVYRELLKEYTLPDPEVECLFECSRINRDYQSRSRSIDESLCSPFIVDASIRYDLNEVHYMEWAKDIIDYQNEAYLPFDADNIWVNGKCYRNYSIEQYNNIMHIYRASIALTNDKIMNPKDINYESKLLHSGNFIELCDDMNRYRLAANIDCDFSIAEKLHLDSTPKRDNRG